MPRDHDLWKQCHNCDQIVPIYEAKKEGKLQDFVETSSNRFDQGKSLVGLDNKKKKTPFQKQT
jgi:ribosomal protein S26